MDTTDLSSFDDDNRIEACRTCSIYFMCNHTLIRPIFTKTGSGDMTEIVQQMNAWNLQVKQNDGRPQYLCISCISEFQNLLKFKRSCMDSQEQFDELECKRAQNGVFVKKEIDPDKKETFCGFIYLDTDDEEDGIEEDGSRRVWAPLDIPHVPIKEEHTARVPQEMQNQPVVSDLPEEAIFAQFKPEELAASNGLSSTLFNFSPQPQESQDSNDSIIRFTYDDDTYGEAVKTLPPPIHEPGVFCKLCGHSSITEAQHTEHMSRIHMLKDCECHICGKKFTNATQSRLKFHMKFHKLQKHVSCPVCGFFCGSKATLQEHKLAVHTRSKCDICGKTMKHQQLQAHLKRHIQEREVELARKVESMQTEQTPAITPPCLIQCAFCEGTFEDTDQLQTHVKHTHRASPPDEPSPTSLGIAKQMQTSDSYTLDSSLLEACHTSVVTESNTSANNSINSPDAGRNQRAKLSMLECNICGKTFNLQIKLNRHLRQHKSVPI